MARKNKQPIFENIEVIDAGAKGKAVAKAPDGRVIFLSNAIPGDVIGNHSNFRINKAVFLSK
jgi:23S rRNA (uracil1939-C5)-methyltransferase